MEIKNNKGMEVRKLNMALVILGARGENGLGGGVAGGEAIGNRQKLKKKGGRIFVNLKLFPLCCVKKPFKKL